MADEAHSRRRDEAVKVFLKTQVPTAVFLVANGGEGRGEGANEGRRRDYLGEGGSTKKSEVPRGQLQWSKGCT